MGQIYLQRFAYRDGATKGAIDEAWGEAFKAFGKSGNWGGVERGVTHHQSYGTAWGGYVVIEVEDPDAFAQYQIFHLQNYGHVVEITWEPVFDMDKAFASTIATFK